MRKSKLPQLSASRLVGKSRQIVSDAEIKTTERPGPTGRMGLLALGVGFGGFLLWAGIAPLDEGVPAQGLVAIDTKRKAVQHLTGGILKEVLVREGSWVKEGQLLIRLDDASTRANYEVVRQHYLGLRAMEGRLQSELGGKSKIDFHPDVMNELGDPQVRQMVSTQEQLFESRRAGLRADLAAFDENIHGQLSQIQGYQDMALNRRNQLALLSEELANTRDLVADGYAPRNRQLELERMASEVYAVLAELQANTMRAKHTVDELKQRAISRRQEYRKEVEGQLSDTGREVQGDAEKFHAVQGDLGRVEIKAPVDGQIVGLAVQSVGAVIAPGQKLMDVVPVDQNLLLEARVAPHMIDRVHEGLPVDVRFSSFAHSPQLVVDGSVVSISSDLLTDQQSGQAYYLARVGITAPGKVKLGSRQLQPGMPVEVIFRTGERSMLTYLLSPLTKRFAASMKEE